MVLASALFYPAYLCTLLVLGAALVPRRAAMLALIVSSTALLAHVVQGWWDILFAPDTTLVAQGAIVTLVFGPAIAYWIAGLPRPGWLADAF